MIKCQQKDILKIRDGVQGHGLQSVLYRYMSPFSENVLLQCGCSIPISWLPRIEQRIARLAMFIRRRQR